MGMIRFARPWIDDTDRSAVGRVLEGHILTHGPECNAFEADFSAFAGEPSASCVTFSSCMGALHLAWIELGIGAGDEVLVSAQSHVATAHAVAWAGATPVFVDCEAATGNVTAAGLRAAITERTRGIALVHFLGIPCDMPAIMEVAREHDLAVVEDCALAVGARWDGRHVGLFGDAGAFSFYPAKHITTGEGGMLMSRRSELAEVSAKRRAFGVDRTRKTLPGTYDVTEVGLNYRMSELHAALGRSQLARIDQILDKRRHHFGMLAELLSDLPGARTLAPNDERATNACYALGLILDESDRRDRLVNSLREDDIETSIYYPHPIPRLEAYRKRNEFVAGDFANATAISDCGVALPVGPHLSMSDVERIAERVRHHVKGGA